MRRGVDVKVEEVKRPPGMLCCLSKKKKVKKKKSKKRVRLGWQSYQSGTKVMLQKRLQCIHQFYIQI